MTLVNESDVDGVRCFWVDTNRPTLRASLLFRQGLVDETLPESGWLHMLEHLALDGKGGGALSIDGSVSLLQTSFDAHGPAEAVGDHLTAVSRWLKEPELARLEHERGVLAAESSARGGPALRALGWRYGSRGPGIFNVGEVGLGRASAGTLRDRAHHVFNRGNAVLVLDGPPPPGLTLDLHDGPLLSPPPAIPCDDTLPGVYRDDAGVLLSGVVDRSHGALMLPYMLQRMLRDRLRHEAGAAYAPWSDYQAVDLGHAVVFAGSDVAAKMLPDLFSEIERLNHTIRDHGLPDDVVREAVDLRLQAINDPYNSMGLAYAAGANVLDGVEPKTFEEIVADVSAVNPANLQGDARAFTETLLVGLPGDAPVSDDWTTIAAPSHPPDPEGMLFKHRDWPASTDELRVGKYRVQVSSGSYARSLPLSAVEAMFVYDDGGRFLIDRDGWGIAIEPGEWGDGENAVKLLDAFVRPERRCPMPARDIAKPQRMSAAKRWATAARRYLQSQRGRKTIAWILVALLLITRGILESR